MPFELACYQGRAAVYAGTLLRADGTALALNAGDRLRLQVYGMGVALDLEDGVASAGGSLLSVTSRGDANNAAAWSLELGQADTAAFPQGQLQVELTVLDSADGFAAKAADATGTLHVMLSGPGTVAP